MVLRAWKREKDGKNYEGTFAKSSLALLQKLLMSLKTFVFGLGGFPGGLRSIPGD
jgi:hypothetical protein